MRTAAIIRRLGVEKGGGISLGIGTRRVSWFSSLFPVCFPSFRSLATTIMHTSTRHWRCLHGPGLPDVSLPQSISIRTSGFFARERLDALRSNTTTKIPRRYFSSNRLQDRKRGAKGDENSRREKSSAIAINKSIIDLGRAGKWKEILGLYHEQKQYFNAVNHSTMMSQFGRIRHMQKDDPLFEGFLDDLSTKLDERGIAWLGKSPQGFANIIHAIAKMALPVKGNSSAMNITRFMGDGKTAKWLFEHGNTQGVANCVWACGTLGLESPNLFQLLDQRSEWLFENGTPQAVANCVWACGSLRCESPNLFRLLDQRIEWLFENGNPQDIANCVWACGTLGVELPNLFQLLDQRSKWLFEHGNAQEVANCVWACGTLGITSPNLFRLLDQRSEWLFENGTPQNVANCVWACGTLGIESHHLIQSLDDNAEWLVQNGNSQEISNCALALSLLGAQAPTLLSALEARLDKYLLDSSTQDVCNLCYAIGVLDDSASSRSGLLVKIWSNILERTTGDWAVEALTQMRYIQACASVHGIELASPPPDLQRQLEHVSFATRSSSFENQVSNILLRIGFPHQREVSPFESFPGLLSIDIACPDRMIAFECDGPSHYLSAVDGVENRRENGPTKAKRRLLQELGWNVINLSWMEARQHQTSEEWIRAKLSEAGVEC